jgi:hypothetical protein
MNTMKGWPALGDVYCNVGGVGAGRASSSRTSGRRGPGLKRSELTSGPGPDGTSNNPPLVVITPPAPRGIGCTAGESRRALNPAGLELHAGASCPGTLWRKAMGLGCAGACTTPLPAVQPGLVTQDDFTTGRAGGDWDGGTGPTITGTLTGPGRWT